MNKRLLTQLAVSFLLTLVTLAAWVWWNGVGLSLGKELSLMQKATAISLLQNQDYSTPPEDFVFINTGCDLALVDVFDDNLIPRGNGCITDREKLSLFLDKVAQQPDYKCIVLDLYLDGHYATPYDSALVSHINYTPRLACAYTGDYPIDTEKMAMVEYRLSMFNSEFCKYLTIDHHNPSLAFKAYSDLYGDDRNILTPGAFIPDLQFNCLSKYDADGNTVIYDLGADLLDTDSDIHALLKDKYVFIGEFGGNDSHMTYLGSMDGVQIHANAFANMLAGRHRLSWSVVLTVGATVWILYFLLIYVKHNHSTNSGNIHSKFKLPKWLKVLISFLSFEILFTIIFFTVQATTGRILELTSLSVLFTILWNIRLSAIKKFFKYIIIMFTSNALIRKLSSLRFFRSASILILLLCSFSITYAEKYKILYVSSPGSVSVSGQAKAKGDTLLSGDIIKWKSAEQALKVVDLNSGKQRVIASTSANNKKNITLASYLLSSKKMATRDGEINTPEALAAALPDSLLLLDVIQIHCNIPQDDNRFFFINYDYNGERINKKLPATYGLFTIDRSIFTIDGNVIAPFSTSVGIYYRDAKAKRNKIIGEDIFIKVYDR